MRRPFSGILLMLLFVSMLPTAFGIGATGVPESSFDEPVAKIVDFKNGTKEMIIDYQNGTQNCISETFLKKTGELLAASNETDQSMTTLLSGTPTSGASPDVMSLTSIDRPIKYTNTTQTVVLKQPMMLGFTYTLVYWQQQWSTEGGWWIFTWYLAVGVDIDIRFGLRLPINVTLEYPEQMITGSNYTIRATLDPADVPDFDELLLTFKANIWAQANICGIDVPRTVLLGPDIDGSRTFVTPLGSDSAPLFLPLEFDIFQIIKEFYPDPGLEIALYWISKVVTPYLVVQPTFGSNRITAKANAIGDARVVEGAEIDWSEPHQTADFLVSADEYDSTTNYGRLILSDFRYYFTKFGVDFDLKFDLNELINLLVEDPILHLCSLDLSWITNIVGTPYVTSHSGYPESIHATIYVERSGNPEPNPPPLEDVAISYAYVAQHKIFAGEILNITVGTKNLGTISETFNVTVYADSSAIHGPSVVELLKGEEKELSFGWNTTGFSPWHVYNMTAKASEIPNEIDKDNNVLSAGTVEIVLQPPIANFTYSPMPPIVNQTTTFNASSSIPGHGTLVSYRWDFGDGNNLTAANPVVTHVFANCGNHTVTLTVIDSGRLNATVWEFVNVNQEEGHDAAVIDVAPYRDWVYQGQPLNINVTVANKGNYTETVEVRLYYNISADEEIGFETKSLNPGEDEALTYTWNTSDVPYCHNYTIIAAAGISFDISPADNIRESYVKVSIPGDVNGDGTVDMLDLTRAARALGSYPGHPRWDPDADQNGDSKINMIDLTLIAIHWKMNCS